MRDLFQSPDVGGDVLALAAVAARRSPDQRAALVAQRHRQAVDLRLGGEHNLLVVLQVQEPADAADKLRDLIGAEGVLQRQHWYRVADLGKAAGWRGAHLAGQAVQGTQVREPCLDLLVAAAQPVVFRVRNRRSVLLVVGLVVLLEFAFEPRVLALGLTLRQVLDGDLGIPGWLGFAGGHGC